MRYYKPIEIARELHISTSALRHYESWGVIPVPERAANGYRLYTDLHLAYFRCLRALAPGFGIGIACSVLRFVQDGKFDDALWLVNKEQAELHQEKTAADQTLQLLHDPAFPVQTMQKQKGRMNIGEVAALTGVQPSAIRHWEKEGLLTPDRDPDNGYRIFTPVHVRQIMLIRTLRRTVYYLEQMKTLVKMVEHHHVEQVRKVTEEALSSIHARNRLQYAGVHQLVALGRTVGLLEC